MNSQAHSRGIFSAANTGSVNLVKNRFERKSSTPSTPLLGLRQKSATPFRSTRSPSPSSSGFLPTNSSLRRRSPSPVNTGNVNRVKNRFEFGNPGNNSSGHFAQTNTNADKYQIAAAKELSSSQQHLPSFHNQTLPKAFKEGVNNTVVAIGANKESNHSDADTKLTSLSQSSINSSLYSTKSVSSQFNPTINNSSKTINTTTGVFRPLRGVGSHLTSSQTNLSIGQRPVLAGIQESTIQPPPSASSYGSNSNLSKLARQDSTGKLKGKLEPIPSPHVSPSLSSGRASSQMSCHSQTSQGTSSSMKKPPPAVVGGNIPSRFMNQQDMVHDAASFLSQKLSNNIPSPSINRNRNLSAGSMPSSNTSSTTSPHLSHNPKLIRGPFGYTDL